MVRALLNCDPLYVLIASKVVLASGHSTTPGMKSVIQHSCVMRLSVVKASKTTHALTSLQLKMQLVCVDVERAREVEHDLEGLASADDELVAVVLLGVVLLTVLTHL